MYKYEFKKILMSLQIKIIVYNLLFLFIDGFSFKKLQLEKNFTR